MSSPGSPTQHNADVKSGDHPRAKPFKFKRKRHHTEEATSKRTHGRRHRHDSRDTSKRRRTSPRVHDDPSAYDDSASGLPPDAAFRESLFDALGDDEGAEFWSGVYGQPIHEYPNTTRNKETGELERMDEEEYAQYVRQKMWEKSWEGIQAAQAKKRQERETEKSKIREAEQSKQQSGPTDRPDAFVFDLEFENSLQRGQRRRDRKRWKRIWEEYLQRWDELRATSAAHTDNPQSIETLFLRNKIAWPVESGKRKDVNAAEVSQFFERCAQALVDDDRHDSPAPLTILKSERVKWHPDKIQQRYGFMEIEEVTMQGVTAVFQVLDSMWNERRNQES